MAFVCNRIYAYVKSNGYKMVASGHKMVIGRLVVAKYLENNSVRKLQHRQAPAWDGDYKVLYYPAKFTAEIDEVIKEYFLLHPQIQRKIQKNISSNTIL